MVSGPSRPEGAWTAICDRSGTPTHLGRVFRCRHRRTHQRLVLSAVLGYAGQDTVKLRQRLSNRQSASRDAKLTNGVLVSAAPLLDRGNRLPHRSLMLEVSQENDGVGEIADLGRLVDGGAEDSVL